eukprot:scaffold12610_cov70-Skeletonema_dohrnii-CCMP3373.AAC.3
MRSVEGGIGRAEQSEQQVTNVSGMARQASYIRSRRNNAQVAADLLVTISVERQLMVDVTWLIFMSFLTAEILALAWRRQKR